MEDNNSITLGGKNQTETNASEHAKNLAEKAEKAGIPQEFVDTQFMVATDMVELPSKGKYYPNNQSSVKVKLLTAEEENILTSTELIKNGTVFERLLEKTILDKDLRPADMLTGDRNAILLSLRSSGYGDDYEVKMSCPECSQIYKTNIQISSLQHKSLAVDSDSNGEFDIFLPRMKANVKFRLLTGKDEIYLNKKEASLKKLQKTVVSTMITERFLIQIMEFDGVRDKIVISKAISAMPASDSLYLRDHIALIEPGVDMGHEFECTNCGHTYEAAVPIQINFFWPSAKA